MFCMRLFVIWNAFIWIPNKWYFYGTHYSPINRRRKMGEWRTSRCQHVSPRWHRYMYETLHWLPDNLLQCHDSSNVQCPEIKKIRTNLFQCIVGIYHIRLNKEKWLIFRLTLILEYIYLYNQLDLKLLFYQSYSATYIEIIKKLVQHSIESESNTMD